MITRCRHELDGDLVNDWQLCSSGFQLTDLGNGNHQLLVRSTDPAGNVSANLSFIWAVDNLAPGAPTISYSAGVATLSGASAGASGESYQYKIVDSNQNIVSPWAATPATFALRLANGNYSLYARLVDDIGNFGEPGIEAITITGQPAGPSATPRATISAVNGYSNLKSLNLIVDWPTGTRNLRVSSTQNSNGGAGFVTALETDWTAQAGHRVRSWTFVPENVPNVTATHQVTVEFLDAAGAVINTQISSVIIDLQAPVITSATPASLNGTSLPITIAASDEAGGSGVGSVIVSRGAIQETLTPVNNVVTVPNVIAGQIMSVRVKDRAGNLSTGAIEVSVKGPQNITPTVAVSGSFKVGAALTASTGTWLDGETFTYQWLLGDQPVVGATQSSYTPTNADAGKSLRVAVTGSKTGYFDLTIKSATAVVTGGTLTPGLAKITGTAKVGKVLTVTPGTWAQAPKLTYVWTRGSTVVSKTATYKLSKLDLGKTLTLTITATKTGFNTLTKKLVSVKIK